MLTHVVACDPKTGARLWFVEGLAEEKVVLIYASPVVSAGIGVAFTGWGNGPTIGFKLGGAGDVTASNRLWLERQPQRIGSGVVVDGLVFIVNAGPGTRSMYGMPDRKNPVDRAARRAEKAGVRS